MKFLIVALVIWAASDNKPIQCWVIAPFVAAYGQAAVIDWARARGYSEAQIAEVTRRCAKREDRK